MQIDHPIQLQILKELLFIPKARFAQLNVTELTNDHFTFHLRRLCELGLVQRDDKNYLLTPTGLELAGRIDVHSLRVIRQAKIGVLICVTRKHAGTLEVLVGERLRDPQKGKIGFYAEKVEFGESFIDTAQRGLQEETGLTGKFKFVGSVHLMDQNTNDPRFSRLMNYIRVTNLKGTLLLTTLESHNMWVPYDKAYLLENRFPDLNQDLDLFKSKKIFFEERYISM